MIRKNNYFFCPACAYLNQHGETGSLGRMSYEFLKTLGETQNGSPITAVVFKSHKTESFNKVKILPLITDPRPNEFSSLKFYLKSYFTLIKSSYYKQANIVHHFFPFSRSLTFNPFFIFKNPSKKYVLGPILGPHTNVELFKSDGPLLGPISNLIVKIVPYLFRPLSALTINNADMVIFNDNYALSCYKKYLRGHQLVKVIGTGVDFKIFDKDQKYTPDRRNDLNVLFVGRLTERKGCQFLIEAIHQVVKNNPQLKIICKIIGFGPQEEELKKLAKSLQISKNIDFVGKVANNKLREHYNKADVVCIPAISDTWTSAKEALCCGKPVIITNIASHPEIVQDGVNGYLAPIMDSKSIAAKLSLLATDKKLINKLSKNAYRLAKKKYDWKKIVNSYLQALEELNENH